ncbi:ABC transporter permease subunit [Planosporangium sp. 12N6]|uniref:branched-chain amino acid ABC transporter ATP-binding protein/permease n=1 Tax=Planosporangium spinosum TaxID=3402278 RepID=UPI003CF58515
MIQGDDFSVYLAITAAAAFILTVSFNLIYGYAGIFSLAHVAVYGIGAYVTCLLQIKMGLPFLVAAVVSMAVCAAVGVLLWLPTRHLKDLFLAIATLGFAVTVQEVLLKWTSVTGGAQGLLGIPYAEIAGAEIAANTLEYYALAALGAWIAWELSARLTRSGMGRKFMALKDAPVALSAVGVSPGRVRLVAFVVSSVLASLAGTIFAHQSLSIASDSFGLHRLILLILAVLIGGVGTQFGPVIGVIALVFIDEAGVASAGYNTLILGVAIILLLSYGRGGIGGLVERLVTSILRRRRPDQLIDVQPTDVGFETRSAKGPLRVENVSVDFGGVRALSDVTLEVAPGRVLGLVGPNGAGKTTLVNIITGHVIPTSGQVTLDGQRLDAQLPYKVARLGVVRTFQTARLIPEVSIVGNVALGFAGTATASDLGEVFDSPAARRDTRDALSKAVGLLRALGVHENLGDPIGSQPYATQRLTEVARALATAPSFLLLDEPGAGLNDHERSTLALIIRQLADAGIGILLIDHNVSFVAEVSDGMHVLDGGQTLAAGEPDDVLGRAEVVDAYLGGNV